MNNKAKICEECAAPHNENKCRNSLKRIRRLIADNYKQLDMIYPTLIVAINWEIDRTIGKKK